jgi:hypothetical protein
MDVVWSGTIERASAEENRRPPSPFEPGLQAGELESEPRKDPRPGAGFTRAELILQYLATREDATTNELSKMLNAHQGAVSPVVYLMLKRGQIEPSGRIVKPRVGSPGRAFRLAR